MPERQRDRIALAQSSLTYRDRPAAGWDAVVLMEVVEHVDPDRLPALEDTVFAAARPATVVVTTPNAEHNVRYAGLAAGELRHPDHRFEWTRAELRAWADAVAAPPRLRRQRSRRSGPTTPRSGRRRSWRCSPATEAA